MKRLIPYLGSVYLVFLGWYGARILGTDWRRDLLIVVLGSYAVTAVLTHLYEVLVRQRIDSIVPRDLERCC